MGSFVCAAALVLGPADRAIGQQASGKESQIEIQQKLPESLTAGQPFPVEFRIFNRGRERVENVAASATLPASWRVLAAEPKAEPEPGVLRWLLGAMEGGSERVLRLRVSATADDRSQGELRSSIRVTYQMSLQDTVVATLHRPALAMRISSPETAPVGEAVSVVIEIANTGGAVAEGVVLQTLLPAGLSHPGGSDLETEVGTVEPGETKRITLTVTPTRAGEFRHRVRVLLHGEPVVEQDARVCAQEMKIAVTANGPRFIYADSSGSFEVALRNDEPRPVEQVSVVVNLPPGLAVALCSDSGVYDGRDHTLRWVLSSLKPGETRTLVWGGVPHKVGDQECKIEVSTSTGGSKRTAWRTSVLAPTESPTDRSVAPMLPPSNPSEPKSRSTSVELKWRQDAKASPVGEPIPDPRDSARESKPPGQVAIGSNGRPMK
jgi:uncharacterized repeat protein (TIGR01451 family)